MIRKRIMTNNINNSKGLNFYLKYQLISGNIRIDELQIETMTKEYENILNQYHVWYDSKDNRYKVKLPNPLYQKKLQLVAKTKLEDLHNAIIEYHLTGKTPSRKNSNRNQMNINSLYDVWYDIRSKECCSNTFAKDCFYYETYIRNYEIANIPLETITEAHLRMWANDIISSYNMKRRYFNNVKGTLNNILNLAKEFHYIAYNPMRDLVIKRNVFAKTIKKKECEQVFTAEEKDAIINYALSDYKKSGNPLALGIVLAFYTGVRVGELSALKFKDCKDGYISIERMLVDNSVLIDGKMRKRGYVVQEHTKTDAGFREIPFPNIQQLIATIRNANIALGYPHGEDDFVFHRTYNKQVSIANHRSFDHLIRKYCKKIGMTCEKSMHDIRRTYITDLLLNKHIPIINVKKWAGHEDEEMTIKYCKNANTIADDINIIFNAFLGDTLLNSICNQV